MKIFVDIDDTICYYKSKEIKQSMDYTQAQPYKKRIGKINKLYDDGNQIIYWTARGTFTQKLWFLTTYNQLKCWGCKFHELRMGKSARGHNLKDYMFFSTNNICEKI